MRGRSHRHTLALKNARVDAEERDGYLFIVATGLLEDLDDVARCTAHFEHLVLERKTKRALLDVRGQTAEPAPEVRAAVWEWFKSDRAFDTCGYLVTETSTMKAARVNMTAVSLGLNLRAFLSVVDAHRFLVPRRASAMMAAVRMPSSFPPPVEGIEDTAARAKKR